MNVEQSMLNAINWYAKIQDRASTIPQNYQNINEVINNLASRIKNNERHPELAETLFVHNSRFYEVHKRFGLREDRVLADELANSYSAEKCGSKRDLFVVKKFYL